ncbi:UNVERIFIED_CONTAM: hypothetical protein BEN50_13840 [Euhalothece sp. KZN 001]
MSGYEWYKGKNNVKIELTKDVGQDKVTFEIHQDGEVCFYVNSCVQRGNTDPFSNLRITKYLFNFWNMLKDSVGTVYCKPYRGLDGVDRDKIYRKLGFEPVLDRDGLEELARSIADEHYREWKREMDQYCNRHGYSYRLDDAYVDTERMDWDDEVYFIIEYTITDPDEPYPDCDTTETEMIYLFNVNDSGLIDLARDYMEEGYIQMNSVLVYQS